VLALHLLRRAREFEMLMTGVGGEKASIEREWSDTGKGLPPRMPMALLRPQDSTLLRFISSSTICCDIDRSIRALQMPKEKIRDDNR
jgi:hypothetical protein